MARVCQWKQEKTQVVSDQNQTYPSNPPPALVFSYLSVPAVVRPAWRPPGLSLHGVGHGQPRQLLECPALTGGGATAYHGSHQESQRVHFVLGRDPALPGTHGVTAGAVATPSSTSGVSSISSTSISSTSIARPSTTSTPTVPDVNVMTFNVMGE